MSTYPQWAAGQRVTASLLLAAQPQTIIKTSDQTVTSSTFVDATDLSFTGDAGAVYIVTSVLSYGAAATPKILLNWRVPAGATIQRYPLHAANAATDTSATTVSMRRRASTSANPGVDGTGNFDTFNEWMILRMSSTAGTVAVQFAQAVTNATGSILRADSYIQYNRIA